MDTIGGYTLYDDVMELSLQLLPFILQTVTRCTRQVHAWGMLQFLTLVATMRHEKEMNIRAPSLGFTLSGPFTGSDIAPKCNTSLSRTFNCTKSPARARQPYSIRRILYSDITALHQDGNLYSQSERRDVKEPRPTVSSRSLRRPDGKEQR
jgi:hypothetical protein